MQSGYLAQIEQELPLPTRRMSLLDGEIKGAARLREVAQRLFENQTDPDLREETSTPTAEVEIVNPKSKIQNPVSAIWPRLLPNGHSRILFFAGKGGVGKTVASCLTAVWLARQGYKTLLLTTDPAAHLGDVLGAPVGDEVALVEGGPNLWATKIDPKAVGEVYKKRILDDARQRGRPVEAISTL
jgi:arsenite-transporting ATPase